MSQIVVKTPNMAEKRNMLNCPWENIEIGTYECTGNREELLMVVKGSGEIICDEDIFYIYSGDYCIVPKGTHYTLKVTSPIKKHFALVR